MMIRAWTCTIPCAPASKHNSRRIRRHGRFTSIALSEEGEAFMQQAILEFKCGGSAHPRIAPTDKIEMHCRIRHTDYRRDLDVQLVKDALQVAGVIPNDRQIRVEHNEIVDDKGSPETHVVLYIVGKLPWKPRVRVRVR